MNHLKKTNKKLEKLRGIFFQLGLIIAGGLTLLAFEWMTPMYSYKLPAPNEIYEEDWEYPPIIPAKEIVKPKIKAPQPKVNPNQFTVVKTVVTPIDPTPNPDPTPDPDPPFDPEKWKTPTEPEADPPRPYAGTMPHYAACKDLKEEERKICTQQKMYAHFGKTIHVPEIIKMKGKGEYKAFVYFEVNKKGEIVNVKILNDKKHEIPKELEREAYNAVSSLPQLLPAKNYGRKVSVLYKVPINFTVK
jgi:periplasmic protein TonB